jgi:hypothetical protein
MQKYILNRRIFNKVLKHIADNDKTCSNTFVEIMAKCGHLNLIIELHDNNFYLTNNMMFNAATYGHLNIVKYLHYCLPQINAKESLDTASVNGH